ncbi:MAG: hypothetical protein U0894_14065 [Pirellulales bacterium]
MIILGLLAALISNQWPCNIETASAAEPAIPQISWGQIRVLSNWLELTNAGLLADFRRLEDRGQFVAVEQKESVYEFQILRKQASAEDLRIRLLIGGEAIQEVDYLTTGLQHSKRNEKSPTQEAYVTIPANDKEVRFSIALKNNLTADKTTIDNKPLKRITIAFATSEKVSGYNFFNEHRPKIISILDDDRWQWADVQITPSGGSSGRVYFNSKKPTVGDIRMAYVEKVVSVCDQNPLKPKISLLAGEQRVFEKYVRNGLGTEWRSYNGTTAGSRAELHIGISQNSGRLLYDRNTSGGSNGSKSAVSYFRVNMHPLKLADGTVVSVPHFQAKVESLVHIGGDVKQQANGGLAFLKLENNACCRRCEAMVSGRVTIVEQPIHEILAERAWEQK